MISERNQPPVLKGKTYCAPWCGRGCTKAEYNRALAGATALARRLGAGWKPRVWENLGWHFEADKGVMSVMVNRYGSSVSHTCYLNTNPQFIAKDKSPKKAVALAIALLDAHIVSMARQRKEVEP